MRAAPDSRDVGSLRIRLGLRLGVSLWVVVISRHLERFFHFDNLSKIDLVVAVISGYWFQANGLMRASKICWPEGGRVLIGWQPSNRDQ